MVAWDLGQKWKLTANEHVRSYQGDGQVLKPDSGDG